MKRKSLVTVLAGAAVAGVIALAAGPALAAGSSSSSPDDLSSVKARAKVAIDKRVDALDRMTATLQADANLGSDRDTLVAVDQRDVAGLQQLGQTIAGDTTTQQAKADAQTIFTAYRVYALVLPVDRMVRFSDQATNVAIPRLEAFAARWSTDPNPQVQSLAADIQHQAQAAGQSLAGLPGRVEAYTPAGWNADHHLLDGDRADVAAARQALVKARADVREVRQLIRSSRAHAGARATADVNVAA
jgi:hypothetical protein